MIRWVLRAAVWLLVFLLCFEAGFEIVMRMIALGVLSVPADSSFRAYHMNIERQILSYMPACTQYDDRLTYILKPGVCQFRNREYDTTLQVNSKGLRDDEASLESPEIIILGDSHAMGWGVQQDEAFPQLLEQASGLKVLNAGEPSYGTARELALLQRLDTSHLRYLVIQYCNNDDGENEQFLRKGGKQIPMSRVDYEQEGADYRAAMRYRPLKYLNFTVDETLFLLGKWSQRQQGIIDSLPPPMEEASGAANRFLDVLEQSGLQLPPGVKILVLNTNGVERRDWPFIAGLQSVLQQRVARQDSLAQAMVTITIPELVDRHYYFGLDDHMNAMGHQQVAKQLLNVIREDEAHAIEQH